MYAYLAILITGQIYVYSALYFVKPALVIRLAHNASQILETLQINAIVSQIIMKSTNQIA